MKSGYEIPASIETPPAARNSLSTNMPSKNADAFLARYRNGLGLENAVREHDPVRRLAAEDDGDVERGRDNAQVLPLRQSPRQFRGRGAAVENDRVTVRYEPRRLAADSRLFFTGRKYPGVPGVIGVEQCLGLA